MALQTTSQSQPEKIDVPFFKVDSYEVLPKPTLGPKDPSILLLTNENFINKAEGTYKSYQRQQGSSQSGNFFEGLQQALSKSGLYKKIITDLQQESQSQANSLGPESQIFMWSLGSIWNLSEIIFLTPKTQNIAEDLIMWVAQIYKDEDEEKFLRFSRSQDFSPEFWQTIERYLLHGNIFQAISLLQIYQSTLPDQKALIALIQLLEKMPTSKHSARDFESWKMDVRRLLSAIQNSRPPYLACVQILFGHSETLSEKCDSWFELFSSCVLFQAGQPAFQKKDIPLILKKVLMVFDVSTAFDKVLQSLMEENVELAVENLREYDPSYWLVSHLYDLWVGIHNEETNLEMREDLLIQYAANLIHVCPQWEICGVYLFTTRGQKGLFAFSRVLAVKSEITPFQKDIFLDLIKEFESDDDQKSAIFKTLGFYYFNKQEFAEAAEMLRQSGDLLRLNHYGNWLVDLMRDDKLPQLKISEDLDKVSVFDFISNFQRLELLWNTKKYQEFLDLSVNLLLSRSAPKEFWPRLLLDIVPILESQQKFKLSQEKIQNLCSLLEELDLWHNSKNFMVNFSVEELQLVRLALTRSLAKSFVFE